MGYQQPTNSNSLHRIGYLPQEAYELANLPLDELDLDDRMWVEERLAYYDSLRAKNTLIGFCEALDPTYIAEPVHYLIAEYLEKAMRKEIKRLMIFAPPQHGKSHLTSVALPPFWLGHFPKTRIMSVSYGSSLSKTHSGYAREYVQSETYKQLFPNVSMSTDTRAKDNWQIRTEIDKYELRSEFLATGMDGAATGYGADLLLIDDPFKDNIEASSTTVRNHVWELYKGKFYTRVPENGVIIIINTRWHEDDLCGRLLEQDKDQHEWTVLRLPAIAETQEERDYNNAKLYLPAGLPDPLNRNPGECLSPNRYPLKTLDNIRRISGPIQWSAQYQGVPTLPEGAWFKKAWFDQQVDPLTIEEIQKRQMTLVRYWDLAASLNTGSYTAGVLLAYEPSTAKTYILDVQRFQLESHERNERIKQTALFDQNRYAGRVNIWFEQEPGGTGKEVAQNMRSVLGGYPVRYEAVTGSKDVRLQSFHACAASGCVYLVKADWNDDFVLEFLEIPNGKYRDQSDATGGAYNKVAQSGLVLGML